MVIYYVADGAKCALPPFTPMDVAMVMIIEVGGITTTVLESIIVSTTTRSMNPFDTMNAEESTVAKRKHLREIHSVPRHETYPVPLPVRPRIQRSLRSACKRESQPSRRISRAKNQTGVDLLIRIAEILARRSGTIHDPTLGLTLWLLVITSGRSSNSTVARMRHLQRKNVATNTVQGTSR